MGDPHSVLFGPFQVTVLPTAKSNQRKEARHLAVTELGMGVIFRCKDLPDEPKRGAAVNTPGSINQLSLLPMSL